VKQRVMSRVGHLSNNAVSEFLEQDFDAKPRVLVLAHLSENNNHPEIARLGAQESLKRVNATGTRLVIASQKQVSEVFEF
jgi:phosphoribosyl 1,2-cyclic phosphodiesterase